MVRVLDQLTPDIDWQYLSPKEGFMNDAGRKGVALLTGLGIGFGLALLFAPWSGEETREWISDTAGQKLYLLRRRSRRSMKRLLDKGEDTFADILRSSKTVLESVAAKLA